MATRTASAPSKLRPRPANRNGSRLFTARWELNLKHKDVEGELGVYRQRVDALETTLDEQTKHLQRLDDQLDQTAQQAQDLAFRAIDSGSQAGTYEAVREIALEQAKGKDRSNA